MPTPTPVPRSTDAPNQNQGHLLHPTSPHDEADARIKARTPPPAYDALPPPNFQLQAPGQGRAAAAAGSSSSSAQPLQRPTQPQSLSPGAYAAPYPYAHPHPPHHPGFGPTPLSTAVPLLPYTYYESPATADARARWRFVGALALGVGLYVLLGMAVGLEVVGESGRAWRRG